METEVKKLLASDHAELDELLARFFSTFETGDVEQIYQKLDLFWARLAMHIRAEHLHLFPAILAAFQTRTQPSRDLPSLEIVKDKIAELQEDHNFFMRELVSAIKLLRQLRDADRQDISKSLTKAREMIFAVKARLETHNELEESEVYEWADRLLGAAGRGALSEKMRLELDNLPPRFEERV